MDILTNLFYQLLFSVGIIFGLGFLIAALRRAFLRLSGKVGYYILLIFGIVGTPIHELSHALMCLIFGHKVKEIKLFSPNSKNGTLGYVNHTYNPKNLYHRVGNFFIGTAPLIGGTAAIMLFMLLFVPDVFNEVHLITASSDSLPTALLSLDTYTEYLNIFITVISAIFAPENFGNILWWLFLVLAVMISSHMELSGADLKGGFGGFAFITLIMLITDTLLYFFAPEALSAMTAGVISFAMSVVGFLGISLVFLLLMLLLAFVLKLVF